MAPRFKFCPFRIKASVHLSALLHLYVVTFLTSESLLRRLGSLFGNCLCALSVCVGFLLPRCWSSSFVHICTCSCRCFLIRFTVESIDLIFGKLGLDFIHVCLYLTIGKISKRDGRGSQHGARSFLWYDSCCEGPLWWFEKTVAKVMRCH